MNFTEHEHHCTCTDPLKLHVWFFVNCRNELIARIQMLVDNRTHLSAGEIDGFGNRTSRFHRQ
jgi:hypothetical protein